MIVCAQCGEGNAPGSEFCGACGTYLEWEPQPTPVPGQVAGEAGRVAQAGHGGQSGQAGHVGQATAACSCCRPRSGWAR